MRTHAPQACGWHALLIAAVLCSSTFAVDIVVSGTDVKQTIDGFGGSIMNWMSGAKSPAWQQFVAQDLGASIVRCELHPDIICDNNCLGGQRTWGADITANMAAMNASRSRNDISFTAAKGLVQYKLDEMKVMISIWTPPHWMKENAQVCNGNFSHGGNIPYTDAAREQNARYLAAAVKKIQAQYGISIYGLSPQNELDWAHACETWTTSCKKYYSGDAQGPGYCTWIPETKRIKQEFVAEGLGAIKIMGPEMAGIGPGEWNLWGQMKYVKDIYNDTAMLRILDIWCEHSYGTPVITGRNIWNWMWNGYSGSGLQWNGYKNYGKPHWQTEVDAGANNWSGAMATANRMQDALIAGNTSGWIFWALGSDDINDQYTITVLSGNFLTIKAHAFKHFARYIRPGAVRLNAAPDNPSGLTVSAYRHDRNGTQTIVLINNSTSAQTANITIPANPRIASFDVYTSRDGSYLVKTTAAVSGGNVVSAPVPASGIVTLYGQSPDVGAIGAPGAGARATVPRIRPAAAGTAVSVTGVAGAYDIAIVDPQGRSLARRHDLRGDSRVDMSAHGAGACLAVVEASGSRTVATISAVR